MPKRSRADLCGRCRYCRGVQHRECRHPGFLFDNLVFESSSGISAPRHAGIRARLDCSRNAAPDFSSVKFQQPVDILVALGGLQAILDFENAGLY